MIRKYVKCQEHKIRIEEQLKLQYQQRCVVEHSRRTHPLGASTRPPMGEPNKAAPYEVVYFADGNQIIPKKSSRKNIASLNYSEVFRMLYNLFRYLLNLGSTTCLLLNLVK
jgi:predicted alpha/beta superfamily hydrolase